MRRVLCRLSNANGARRTVITGSRLECLSMYELNPGASATTSTSSFVHSAEAVTFTPLKRTETSDIAFKIETLATLTTELAYDLPENLTRKASLAKLMIKEGKCTIQEVVEFAEVCCRRKLKQPLLDILLDLKLDDDTDANEVAQLLRIMGSTELYPATIFDWIYERIDRLDCRGMSTFLYECGRHGLRCKHFADRAVPRAAKMVPDMSVEEVMRTTQGLIRFIRDWRGRFLRVFGFFYLVNISVYVWWGRGNLRRILFFVVICGVTKVWDFGLYGTRSKMVTKSRCDTPFLVSFKRVFV